MIPVFDSFGHVLRNGAAASSGNCLTFLRNCQPVSPGGRTISIPSSGGSGSRPPSPASQLAPALFQFLKNYSHRRGCEDGAALKSLSRASDRWDISQIPCGFRPGQGPGRVWRNSELDLHPRGLDPRCCPQHNPCAAGATWTLTSGSGTWLCMF